MFNMRRKIMNKFNLDIPKSRIKEYEKNAILLEKPDFIIPMKFTDYGEKYRVTYDYAGFIPVCNADGCLTVKNVFDYIKDIIGIFRITSSFLIFPERFQLRKETVYINRSEKKVKIMFMPPEENFDPKEELLRFINDMQNMYITKAAAEYSEIFKEYIYENSTLSELQNRAVMMKRDAFVCGIN